MASSGAVQVKLELGHRALVRKKPTVEGFTHDWMVFVRGPEHSNIQHFVEKVVFHLHESFPRPKRVCKDPPYKVEESGYAGFILPIEVYFKNKEEPKKVRFDYDLFLHLEGHPPVNHLRCEKLTFNNPTEEFRRKLLKAGGQRDPHKRSSEDSKVMVMQEGSTSLFGQHLKLPTLPSSSLTLTFSDVKKSKSFPGSKVSRYNGALHVRKDLYLDIHWKSSFSESSQKQQACPTLLQHHHSDKKVLKDKPQIRPSRLQNTELSEKRKPLALPPFQDVLDPNDSDMDDNTFTRSDSDQPSPASSSSSSSSGYGRAHKRQVLGPLRSVIPDLHSDENEEDSEEEDDNDMDSDMERPLHTQMTHRHRRVSLSDGSDSENSSASSPLPHNDPQPLLKTANNQIVNLIEETGHFHITNTTFDFDLCSLDKTTVRKLQSYLETSGAS
ncbi:protein AF-9-like [Sinocyclocheilus grahami]|uniref:protein AF-9-like n=1 Tax=Sinocyclocheilus grahami TaxID=75366 RepID=UPI0007AC932E|nr:PREDICTED: protein AF-9-like [Sinocyclocheilus grahami]